MPRYRLFGNPCRTSGVARTNAAAAVVAVAGTTFEPNILKKTLRRSDETDHGGFQQQSPQQLVDRYEHIMNSRNKW